MFRRLWTRPENSTAGNDITVIRSRPKISSVQKLRWKDRKQLTVLKLPAWTFRLLQSSFPSGHCSSQAAGNSATLQPSCFIPFPLELQFPPSLTLDVTVTLNQDCCCHCYCRDYCRGQSWEESAFDEHNVDKITLTEAVSSFCSSHETTTLHNAITSARK